ncbi:MAG: DUF1772 domain-containing protein [Myxococcales bacterium]|nr:DUF1772 domain-containing protein [Myxococcales bacterium]
MILTVFSLAMASAFAGAALYINWSEQPARMGLDDRAMLRAWKPSYRRGFEMQASLAAVSGVLGVVAGIMEHAPLACFGGGLMLANWPFTLLAIAPVNRALGATEEAAADASTRQLMHRWGRLHAVRTALGCAGTALFVWALAAA